MVMASLPPPAPAASRVTNATVNVTRANSSNQRGSSAGVLLVGAIAAALLACFV
jgi:hypothetical protein